MNRAGILLLAVLPCSGAVNVPLTVQEAIYPGVSGTARTADPVTVGIPLPDDASNGLSDVNQLTLAGASVGQFRVLGRWPSGRIKWLLVDTQVSLGAGQKNTGISLTGGGAGNFGGAPLAVDGGSTITVDTGAARFTIRKANFNGIDQVTMGTSTVLTAGASQGLVVYGPAPGQTTCPPCTTVYSSANDANSTAVIEENGPAKAVIRASGTHVDGAGNSYMRFTVRLYFYKSKSHVKITSILRNADYGPSNSFATAFKGHEGYELQFSPAMAGAANYSIGTHTGTPSTGTLASADRVHLYQGESSYLKGQDWCGYGCIPYTPDTGYSIVKNGSPVSTGTKDQPAAGWADVTSSRGTGVQIGIYQMAAHWPKSLVIDKGGSDVRIGIWARESSQPHYQPWPQWSIHDLFVNFHAAPLASAATEFQRFQHYLVGRAAYTHYNQARVFPYPLVDPAVEDAYYTSTANSANPKTIAASRGCCIQDLGTANTGLWPLHVTRFYAWRAGGGANQTEFRWSYLLNFLTRGMTGRYLEAAHFYKFQAEAFLPHSDGFDWRAKPSEVDGFGMPSAQSANSTLAFRNWRDQEHGHWYGMPDYYFLTGDETIREAMNDQAKDWYLNNHTYQAGMLGGKSGTVNTAGTAVTLVSGNPFIPNLAGGSININGAAYPVASVTNGSSLVLGASAGNQAGVPYDALGGVWNTRSVGGQMIGAARYSQFLAATGDADSDAVLEQGKLSYAMQARPDLCVSGYPVGCVTGPADGGPWDTVGINRVRGVPWGPNGTTGELCGVSPHTYRHQSSFQAAILTQGLLELRNVAGAGWADYWTALDLAYGVARWNLTENYVDDGSGRWDVNGFRYGMVLDRDHLCTGPGESADGYFQPQPTQTTAMSFWAKHLVDGGREWETKFKIHLQRDMSSLGMSTSDFGSYQPAALISILSAAGSGATLRDVPIASFASAGGGSYTISWVVPAGASRYRIKWGPKRIVDWVGFDPKTNKFTGDPVATMPWFAARHVDAPAPLAAGATQSMTISTGVTGLSAANFSVRAYVSSGGTPAPAPAAANLAAVSGNGQTGAPGTALAAPFVVKVTGSDGSPVPGVAVDFSVTAGGGTLSSTQSATDDLGQAQTTLTLGLADGLNTVNASTGSLTGVAVVFSANGVSGGSGGAATSMSLVSGNNQSGATGQALANPLVVRVVDSAANATAGVSVSFRITSGGGSLSATDAVTDAQGLASSRLTLGSTAGDVVVAASSGTLAGSPVLFTATATSSSSSGAPSITWTRQTPDPNWPVWIGWHQPLFDPVSKRTIFYVSPSTYRGIYSSGLFFYDAASNGIVSVGGSGSSFNSCPADTPSQPGDRHPVGQMAIDTKRNLLWMYGGANQLCPDNPRRDMYYLTLNANPADNTWRQVSPATLPAARIASAMIYDPDNDVLFAFGSDVGSQTHDNWVYCRTAENPVPGTPTARQIAAGCSRGDDWNEVSVQGGVQPPAVNFPGLVYDPVSKTAILYAGASSGGGNLNETWAYDIAARKWTKRAAATVPPPVYNVDIVGPPPMAYDPSAGRLFYHQTHNTGAPADWMYEPATDKWTKLASTGGGPAIFAFMTYDAAAKSLIAFSQREPGSGYPDIWVGSTSGAPSTPPPGNPPAANRCDLNGDTAVNVFDVQSAIRQAMGTIPCTNGDINGDRACTAVDVDRVIAATLGTGCVTTQ